MFLKAKKWAKYSGLAFLAWFTIHTVISCIDGLRDDNCTTDVAVVLGNKVNEDGTLSNRLKARLDKSVELFKAKSVKRIIVSGGLGKEGFYEGDKMKEYLVQSGVPDSLVITDNKGDNTLKTVENTIGVCKANRYKSVTVVSQYFHITRTKTMFKHQSNLVVCGASPNYFEWRDFYAVTREFFAYYAYLL